MNRMLRCLSTPTVSSSISPIFDVSILRNVNRRVRYYIDERWFLNSKHGVRSASPSRLMCNNQQQRRRIGTKRSHVPTMSNPLDTRPVIILPRDFRSIRFEEAHVQQSSLSRRNDIAEVLFSATGKEVEKYPEGKPNWEKLQHICLRLAETWPKFFVMRMDYTVFRDDVILEDRIYGLNIRGVNNYRLYLGALASAGRILYPQIEMHIMNLTPFLEDATVRLRWQIYYMNFLDFLIMLIRFKPFSAEYMKKYGRITDGYSIYYVDSAGAVYRHVIDRVIPDDEKGLAKSRFTLPQRLMALLGGAPAPKQAAPTA